MDILARHQFTFLIILVVAYQTGCGGHKDLSITFSDEGIRLGSDSTNSWISDVYASDKIYVVGFSQPIKQDSTGHLFAMSVLDNNITYSVLQDEIDISLAINLSPKFKKVDNNILPYWIDNSSGKSCLTVYFPTTDNTSQVCINSITTWDPSNNDKSSIDSIVVARDASDSSLFHIFNIVDMTHKELKINFFAQDIFITHRRSRPYVLIASPTEAGTAITECPLDSDSFNSCPTVAETSDYISKISMQSELDSIAAAYHYLPNINQLNFKISSIDGEILCDIIGTPFVLGAYIDDNIRRYSSVYYELTNPSDGSISLMKSDCINSSGLPDSTVENMVFQFGIFKLTDRRFIYYNKYNEFGVMNSYILKLD